MKSSSEIKWIERSQINIEKWNQLIARSKAVTIYSYSWYLDAVSDNWGALVLGDYEAIMPIPFTVKKGQKIVYQPFFSRQIGVFGLKDFQDYHWFISLIPAKFKLIHFGFPYKTSGEFESEEVEHQELDLSNKYEDLFKSYSTNAKRQIKKALKNEVKVRLLETPKVLIDLFRETKGEDIGLTEENYTHLEKLMSEGLSQNSAMLLGAYQGDLLIASGYYFIENNRITYLKGASNKIGRELGAMYLLMNYVIEKYAGSDKVFDFGGSKIDTIASFYKKFGAVDQSYYMCSKNKLPLLIKQVKRIRDKIKKA